MGEQVLFANVGLGNMVQVQRVMAIINPHTATAKRYISMAKQRSCYIDATTGRTTKSILLLDDGSVMVSSIRPQTLVRRFYSDTSGAEPDEEQFAFWDREDIEEDDEPEEEPQDEDN